MLNVTWIAGPVAFSAVPNGLVNTVQTYCGLEIDIMQINPSSNCTQRVEVAGRIGVGGGGQTHDKLQQSHP